MTNTSHYVYTEQDPSQGSYVRRHCYFGSDEFTRGNFVRVAGNSEGNVTYYMLPASFDHDMVTADTHATPEDLCAARAFLAYLAEPTADDSHWTACEVCDDETLDAGSLAWIYAHSATGK
jgi:hypothetical protein